MPKVLILDPEGPAYTDVFAEHGIERRFGVVAPSDEAAVIAAAQDCEAILFADTRFTESLFGALPKLKIISRRGIGIDTVDLEAATRHGVTVCNCAHYGTYDVAEHTVALILSLLHSIPRYDKAVKDSNNWSTDGVPYARRLSRRKLGIIGFGRISKWICKLLSGFGMEIMVYDPYLPPETPMEPGITPVALDTLLSESDIISLNAPLTRETRHMINAEAISRMKDGVLLINTSRGPLIDEAALIEALESGKVGGAALDVFEAEPFADSCKLRSFPNVVLTPHVAWRSQEAIQALYAEVTGNIIDYFAGRPLRNALNGKQ